MATNLQFLTQVTGASIIEYIGDASFKMYARINSQWYLLLGMIMIMIQTQTRKMI